MVVRVLTVSKLILTVRMMMILLFNEHISEHNQTTHLNFSFNHSIYLKIIKK